MNSGCHHYYSSDHHNNIPWITPPNPPDYCRIHQQQSHLYGPPPPPRQLIYPQPGMPAETQPMGYYHHHQHLSQRQPNETYAASSSRQMRNQAEKQRRDKLNQFINELAMLVPMVASSAKKLDKTSILRLSATFLRIHQILVNKHKETKQKQLTLPLNWCHSMLHGMDGTLLVVTATGKIVFVTHNVESLLGHSQTDLLGQSLFNITYLEDHEELKKNLTPDSDVDRPSTSTAPPALPSTSSTSESSSRNPERRSFYLRLRHKTTSKSEQPQYEMVHVIGHLRVPPASPSCKKKGEVTHISNEVILVALFKPFKEKRITQHSLLEASREEWISRHLIDGRIVFSDQRISCVSGYMAEEVAGTFAFQYMHQDDVRWVLIALKQMYYTEESYGSSCYRLKSKTGEFVYIRTHGYLEMNEETNSVVSFVCINSLVAKEEGENSIKAMKTLYTPVVTQREPCFAQLTEFNNDYKEPVRDILKPIHVEDPCELKSAVDQLLTDLPCDQIRPKKTDMPVHDVQFVKITSASKNLPPVQVQANKITPKLPLLKKSPRYSRPSVITRAKEKRCGAEEDKTNASSKKMKYEASVITLSSTKRSVIQSREDYISEESITAPSLTDSSPGSVFLVQSPSTPGQNFGGSGSIGYLSPPAEHVVSPTGVVGGDPLQITGDFLSSPSEQSTASDYFSSTEHQRPLPLMDQRALDLIDQQPTSMDVLFANSLLDVGSLDGREPCPLEEMPLDDDLNVPVDMPIGVWENDMAVLEEGVVRGHLQLEDRIKFQESQISAIEDDLTSVPLNLGSHIYRSTVTQLKAEHRKQHQRLKTLQQDHQNIQHCKDQLAMCNAQDIGA